MDRILFGMLDRCNGALYIELPPSIRGVFMEWKDYQEAIAKDSDHWSDRRYRALAVNVARRLPVSEGICLDAGCGEGLVSRALSEYRPSLRLHGTDISVTRLRRAAGRVSRSRFAAGDLLRLPWKDDAFDAVVCCEVLEHLPDPAPAVRELFRVAKPGGIVLVTVPDRQKLSCSTCPQCGLTVYKDGHIHSFAPENVRELLGACGDVISVVSIGRTWRMVKRRLLSWLPGRTYKGRYLLGTARKP